MSRANEQAFPIPLTDDFMKNGIAESVAILLQQVKELTAANEKLTAFKKLTHELLDAMNVPRFDDEECRVKARLDHVHNMVLAWAESEAEKDRRIESQDNRIRALCEENLEAYIELEDENKRMQSVVDAAVKDNWTEKLYKWFVSECSALPDSGDVVDASARPMFDALCDFRAAVDAYLAARSAEQQPLFTVAQEPDGHRTVLMSRDLIEAGQRASEDTAARDAEVKP